MDYEGWLWLKLLLVAVGAFVVRFVIALREPEQRDSRSERPPR
jgi:hypothetical protein